MRQPDGTYEALDTKLARSAKPAYILQLLFYNEQLARIQGREPERIHVLLGNGEQQSFRPQRVRRLLPARPLAARALRRRPAADRAVPGRPLPHLRLQARLRRVLGLRRPPLAASPGSTGRRSRGSTPPGSRRSPQLGRAPAEPVPAGINADTLGEEPRAGRAPAARARDRRRHLPAPPAAAGGRLLAPARPLARRPLLRLRGQPVLGRERLARVPLGDPRRRRQLHAAPRARPRDRAARVRAASSTSSTSGSRATPTCTSTTTPPTRSPRSSG